MTKYNGGPAFPRDALGKDCGRSYGHQDGMSLRDYFAGQALAGLVTLDADCGPKGYAHDAYQIADAMLAARKDTPDADT